MSRYASAATSAALGAGLAAIAFAARGGLQLGRVTWAEIGAVVVGGLLFAIALVRGDRRGGGLTLLLFAALAVLCGLSVTWSVAPELSWRTTDMTLAYVAVFVSAVAIARLRRDGVVIVLRAILLASAAVILYALATRVWPSLSRDDVFARLTEPFGYWNALGSAAALAVPPALWLGSRRSGHQPANALAYPLLSLATVVMVLSYSWGALAVAGIGAALWLAFVPLRLRSATVLVVALLGAVPLIAWAFGQDAFTKNGASMHVREAVATEFGLYVVATAIVMLGAGLVIGFRVARRAPRPRARLRLGVAGAAIGCCALVAACLVLAGTHRGLGGTVSDGWRTLTHQPKPSAHGRGRLLADGAARGPYWHEAKKVFLDEPLIGRGAGSFGLARLRYRRSDAVVQHAHGYVHQTAADLGAAGLAISLVLLIAWLVAARRATGVGRRGREFHAERVGLVALALAAVVFGLHSLIDWVWFVPGPASMAMVAAGCVAGRSRLRSAEDEAVEIVKPPPRLLRVLVALGAVAAALAAAWAIWQPLRSDQQSDHALDLLGRTEAAPALQAAKRAHDLDPVAPRPYAVRAAIEDATGDKAAAEGTLKAATAAFPRDPQTWIDLAEYQLRSRSEVTGAMASAQHALYLDPRSQEAQALYSQASTGQTGATPVTPPAPGGVPTAPPPPVTPRGGP